MVYWPAKPASCRMASSSDTVWAGVAERKVRPRLVGASQQVKLRLLLVGCHRQQHIGGRLRGLCREGVLWIGVHKDSLDGPAARHCGEGEGQGGGGKKVDGSRGLEFPLGNHKHTVLLGHLLCLGRRQLRQKGMVEAVLNELYLQRQGKGLLLGCAGSRR